jgi:hypothetical protein
MITIGFQAPKRAVVPACLTSPLWCIFFLVWATFFLKGADLVLPAGLDNKDGNLSGGFQLNNQRLQQAFSGSLFTSAPSSALEIYELRLRVDPNSVPFSATPEFEIRMST